MHPVYRSGNVVFLGPRVTAEAGGPLHGVRALVRASGLSGVHRHLLTWVLPVCLLSSLILTMHQRMPSALAATTPTGVTSLAGSVQGATSAGVLSVVCRHGGGHQRLTRQNRWQFKLALEQASAPCLLDWRADNGQRFLGVLQRLKAGADDPQNVAVSAQSHLWVNYLRHVPLLLTGSTANIHDWFAQTQVQALLTDDATLQRLRQQHFLPALACLSKKVGTSPSAEDADGLERALFRSQALDQQGHPSVEATTVLIHAAMNSASAQHTSCKQVQKEDYADEKVASH